jgi:mRNA interferase HigB
MDILTKARFLEAARLYPNDKSGLMRCMRMLSEARPGSYEDLQKTFGTQNIDLFKYRAELGWVVIDVGGNNLRVIGGVMYAKGLRKARFYVIHIYTHADYTVANDWYARNKGTKP